MGDQPLVRLAFAMSVYPGAEGAYRDRHNPIWPELAAALHDAGVHTYSIYLEPRTLRLVAYVEVEDVERWDAIGSTEVCRRWWASMRHLMPTHPDDRPVQTDLEEVFHIEF